MGPFKCYVTQGGRGWGVHESAQINVTKVRAPTLIALRGAGGGGALDNT